jgi:DNA repair protein RadC
MSPEPGALVAEAGAPGVEARELGYTRDPAAVAAVLAPYVAAVQADQEAFVILVLNATRRIVQLIPLFRGGMTSAPVDPKVVLRAVLVAGGTVFVAAHHHPSGYPRPSPEDRQLTKRLSLAAEAVGLRCVDHVIVPDGRPGCFSVAHAGQLYASCANGRGRSAPAGVGASSRRPRSPSPRGGLSCPLLT